MAIRQHALFRRVDTPPPDVAKGGCYYSFDTGPGVDTGILIDFEGTLFLSLNTIKELAEVAGFSVNAEGEAQEQEVEWLKRRVAELEEENAAYVENLKAVGAAIRAAG